MQLTPTTRLRSRIGAAALIVSLAGAALAGAVLGGHASARAEEKFDDVHPSAEVRRLGAVHQIVQDMDRRSFDKAIAYYPNATGEPYSIDMAEYLFWKLAISFQSRARPGKLSLSDFSELCTRQEAEIGPGSSAVCRLSIAIDVVRDGQTTTYKVRGTVNTGRWFDPARKAYRPTVRVEVRGLLDQLVARLVTRLKRGGMPMR